MGADAGGASETFVINGAIKTVEGSYVTEPKGEVIEIETVWEKAVIKIVR